MLKFEKSSSKEPVSVKLCTKHSWLKEIQVCSNEGQCPFPRWNNNTILEIHLPSLKIFFRTIVPVSTKLGTKHPWVKGTDILEIRTIQFSRKRWWVFSSPNQCYDIFHSFAHLCLLIWTGFSGEQVAHGPLGFVVFFIFVIHVLPFFYQNFDHIVCHILFKRLNRP